MSRAITFDGAQVLRPEGFETASLAVAKGIIADGPIGRRVDLSGYWILPGIVDIHGDGFERHVAPRRGAMKDVAEGLRATEAELAAQGVTTAVVAQAVSWEGGLRGPEFAHLVFSALRDMRDDCVTDMRAQLRFETHLLEVYDALPRWMVNWEVDYVVFNDHLPHERLSQGRKPAGLTGKALGAGMSPDDYFAFLLELHAKTPDVRAALPGLVAALHEAGITTGSHDDTAATDRHWWGDLGVSIAEFPESADAAEAARARGDAIIMGCPNVVRGGSHKGNTSALDLVAMGLCDALASDYHYPSMRRAAMLVADGGLRDMPGAWDLISATPARILGLADRGALESGLRADLVVMEPETRRVCATMAGGRFSYLVADVAERLIGG